MESLIPRFPQFCGDVTSSRCPQKNAGDGLTDNGVTNDGSRHGLGLLADDTANDRNKHTSREDLKWGIHGSAMNAARMS